MLSTFPAKRKKFSLFPPVFPSHFRKISPLAGGLFRRGSCAAAVFAKSFPHFTAAGCPVQKDTAQNDALEASAPSIPPHQIRRCWPAGSRRKNSSKKEHRRKAHALIGSFISFSQGCTVPSSASASYGRPDRGLPPCAGRPPARRSGSPRRWSLSTSRRTA